MLRRVGLFSVLVLVITLLPAVAHAACSDEGQFAGHCGTAEIAEPEVVLTLEGDEYGEGPQVDESERGVGRQVCSFVVSSRCAVRGHHGEIPPATQPIAMSDIARFRPSPPVDTMEPNGWAVVGLDTNFYSTGASEVVDGTLLGQTASVRFTPVSWRWTYGDGASAVSSTQGASWASHGIRKFDPTATSHVYRRPGTYVIDLSVDYRAEYRFAAGTWTRIPGVLSVPANQLEATVGDAKTVLVSGDCTVVPRGSGC